MADDHRPPTETEVERDLRGRRAGRRLQLRERAVRRRARRARRRSPPRRPPAAARRPWPASASCPAPASGPSTAARSTPTSRTSCTSRSSTSRSRRTELEGRFDVIARIHGGGITGQAGALRLGVARCLNAIDVEANRPSLKKAGLLTRDARVIERKKAGLKKARKAPQYSKR